MNRRTLYSPEENHLGVIYSEWFGRRRFQRFVTEKQFCLVGPRKVTRRFVLKEVYLGPRTLEFSFPDVVTKDQIHLEVDLKVFYRFDPRDANDDMFTQMLHANNQVFEGIIRTNLTEKLRNEVFIQKNFEEIFSYQGRRTLRKVLSSRVAERVRNFGIAVNPLFGVAFMNIQPNKYFQKAMHEASAAVLQGKAAIERVSQPLPHPDEAIALLYTQTASAVAKTGNIPDQIYHHENGDGLLSAKREQKRRKSSSAKRRKQTSENPHDLPVAAD